MRVSGLHQRHGRTRSACVGTRRATRWDAEPRSRPAIASRGWLQPDTCARRGTIVQVPLIPAPHARQDRRSRHRFISALLAFPTASPSNPVLASGSALNGCQAGATRPACEWHIRRRAKLTGQLVMSIWWRASVLDFCSAGERGRGRPWSLSFSFTALLGLDPLSQARSTARLHLPSPV